MEFLSLIFQGSIERINPGFFPDYGEKWHAWDWHVQVLAIPGFLLCVFFFIIGIKFRNNKKAANLILFFMGLFLALFETYKQICYNYMRGFNVINGYAWDVFPWQICSIPMYIALIMPFIKNDKRRDVLIAFMAVFGMIGGFAALFFNQENLFSWGDVGIYVHTIVWHLVLMMLGFFSIGYLSIGKGSYLRNINIWSYTYLLLIIFSVVAEGINFIIPLIYGEKSAAAMNTNMWYFSMWYPSPVFVLSNLWNLSPGINGWGWIVAYFVYLFALGLADFIIINIYYFTYKFFSYLKFKRKIRRLEIGQNL